MLYSRRIVHVPMVGISYDPKIERFLETLGEHTIGTLQNISVDHLLDEVRQIWSAKTQSTQHKCEQSNSCWTKLFVMRNWH